MRIATAPDSLPQLPIPGPAGNRQLAYARALTFTVWFFFLIINYWWRQEWNDVMEMVEGGEDLRKFYYVGISVAFVGHLTLGPRAWIEMPFTMLSSTTGRILTAFFVFMLVLAPFSMSPRTSALYAAATWCVLLLCYLFWTSDYQILRQVLVFTGFVLFAWLLILLFHHGLRQQTIGGINRNMIGKAALVGTIFTLFAHLKWVRWTGIALGAFFLVLVSSRGTLLVMGFFLLIYYSLHEGSTKAILAGTGLFIVGAFVLLASSGASNAILENVLHLHSRDRGLGSGFSGRLENWKMGLDLVRERLVFGYGFRAAASSSSGIPRVHSGYINILLETGVVGTALILGTMFTEIIQRVLIIFRIQKATEHVDRWSTPWADTLQINSIAVGVLSLMLVIWIYEPIYINLGSPLALLMFLMLASPKLTPATAINLKR
jgi:O-antigen ligase